MKHKIRVFLVIPGTGSGHDMVFCRRQVAALRSLGVEVREFFLGSRVSPFKVIREFIRLRREIRLFSPDIIHSHYGTITAFLTVNASSAPSVITFHGSDLNPVPGGGYIRTKIAHLLSFMAAIKAKKIICVSSGLCGRLGRLAVKASILPMGCPTNDFVPISRADARRQLGWTHEDPVCLFNGTRKEGKRLDLAEQSYLIAKKSIPSLRLEIMRGGIVPEMVPLYMNASDVLLLTSDYEGSPTVVKEAISCGLPVVSVDVGDVSERLRGVSPSRVVSRSAEALGDAIVKVLGEKCRSNGREIAVRDLDDAVIARRLLHIYREVLI